MTDKRQQESVYYGQMIFDNLMEGMRCASGMESSTVKPLSDREQQYGAHVLEHFRLIFEAGVYNDSANIIDEFLLEHLEADVPTDRPKDLKDLPDDQYAFLLERCSEERVKDMEALATVFRMLSAAAMAEARE